MNCFKLINPVSKKSGGIGTQLSDDFPWMTGYLHRHGGGSVIWGLSAAGKGTQVKVKKNLEENLLQSV